MADQTLSLTLASDLNELDSTEPFVDKIADRLGCGEETRHHIMLVLTEAVTNAIVHGNKEHPDKSVTVKAHFSPGRVHLSVTDQGEGFDPQRIPHPLKEENLLKSSGRGIWLMHEYADEVHFTDSGRTVHLEFDV